MKRFVGWVVMKAVSLFSGAGGMDLGFEDAGFRTALACEMDRTAAATWTRNFAGRMHCGDVNGLLPSLAGFSADAVFGGPPCQGFSVAGRMDPEDPRSRLVFSFLEAVRLVLPEVFVMENVDALASLSRWRGALEAIRARASEIGYSTCVLVLNAADFGVPQSRRRMFMWGSRSLSQDGLSRVVEGALAARRTAPVPSRRVFERFGPAGTDSNPATASAAITFAKNPVLRASPYAGMLFNGGGRPIDPDAPAPTMSASAGGNRTHIVDERQVFCGEEAFAARYLRRLEGGGGVMEGRAPEYLRRLTLRESAAFQTFPEGFVFEGRASAVYRQIGNAVPRLLARAVAEAAAEVIGATGGRLMAA